MGFLGGERGERGEGLTHHGEGRDCSLWRVGVQGKEQWRVIPGAARSDPLWGPAVPESTRAAQPRQHGPLRCADLSMSHYLGSAHM